MLETTAAEFARTAGGTLIGGATGAESVTGRARIDSRLVAPGDLFAAFHGENTNGHHYVRTARDAGAVLALVSEDVDVPAVKVQDVGAALTALSAQQLARARRERPELTVLAITGSAGKTGTKDLLGHLLTPIGPTVSPAGSHNNELGLPLTVLSLAADTRFLVLEMGARGIGHIAQLTRTAAPDIAIVLNVGSAHLGEFGSVDAIARAKGELVEALPADGRAVLSADDARVAAMASRTTAPAVTWGIERGDVRARDLTLDDDARARFTLAVTTPLTRRDGSVLEAGERQVTLQLLGEHQAMNAVAAATAALLAGAELDQVTDALATASVTSGQRMETHRAGGVTVINDAYNANPDSMRHALKTLAHLGRSRRTIAVLGQMLELGDDSALLHDEIGRLAVRLNVSRLIVVGQGAAAIHQGASLEGSFGGESTHVATLEDARAVLERSVEPGDVVLLKSSRDAGLRTLAEPLLEHLATGVRPDQGDVPE